MTFGISAGARIGLAHDDEDLGVRVHSPGDPPLAAVDHVVVAIALDAGSNVAPEGVRRP